MVGTSLGRACDTNPKCVGKLYLHPVQDVQQLRPSLTYLDAMSKKHKRVHGDDSDDDAPPPDPDDPPLASTTLKVSREHQYGHNILRVMFAGEEQVGV